MAELPVSARIKFLWNRDLDVQLWNSWLPQTQCYIHLESLSSLEHSWRKERIHHLSRSPTWSFLIQPRCPICQPELPPTLFADYIQLIQPQRHKCSSPAGMQSTRGISVMSSCNTSREIQDRVVRSLFSWWIFLLEVGLLLLFTTGTDMM